MTIKEVLEMYKGQYYCVEIYKDKFQHKAGFHTDRIVYVDGASDETEVIEHELMDKSEYENTILANTDVRWDDCYEENDKILVLKIKE